jgi:CRP-like cAMP-binding protein
MEEYRYYEGIQRQREAELIAYLSLSDDRDRQRRVIQQIYRTPFSPGILQKGQTTAILETTKASENDIAKVLDTTSITLSKIVDAVAALKK